MTTSDLLTRLRSATAARHAAVETDAEVEAGLRDLARRREGVGRLLDFHLAVDAGLADWAQPMTCQGHVPDRRSQAIRAEWPDLPGDPGAPLAMPSLGHAFGAAYVAEGSMLGGRIMRKAMMRDGIPLTGLAFLDPFGPETGTRFQSLIAAMDRACATGQAEPEAVIEGAQVAFDLAYERLVPPTLTKAA